MKNKFLIAVAVLSISFATSNSAQALASTVNSYDIGMQLSESTMLPTVGIGNSNKGVEYALALSKDDETDVYYYDGFMHGDRVMAVDWQRLKAEKNNHYDMVLAGFSITGSSDDIYDTELEDPNSNFRIFTSDTKTMQNGSQNLVQNQVRSNMAYYQNRFGWTGIDNNLTQPVRLLIYADATDDIAFEGHMQTNAAALPSSLSSRTAFIGVGKGGIRTSNGIDYTLKNLAESDTMLAHEYSHLIQWSVMADKTKSEYTEYDPFATGNEDMAVQEAIADIFAATKTGNWIFTSDASSVAENGSSYRRSLKSPAQYNMPGTSTPYPSTMSEASNLEANQAGTVLGHAFYMFSEGGVFNGKEFSGISAKNAELSHCSH
ncbi:hypothetical protein [Lacticaseibacillus saniviri]